MFTDREVIDAIRRMRKVGSDTQAWEVKEAVLDLPKSLSETISAFANLHGGMDHPGTLRAKRLHARGRIRRGGDLLKNADHRRRAHARRAHGN